jgi:DNA-binding LytR/AlgR family response regulator
MLNRIAANLRVRWPLAAAGSYSVLFLAWLASHTRGPPALAIQASSWSTIPVQALAILLIARLLLRRDMPARRRAAWALIMAGMMLNVLGTVIWALRVAGDAVSTPNASDPLYSLGYPFFTVALLLLFLDLGGSLRRPRAWVDATTLALALGATIWAIVIAPMTIPTAGSPGFSPSIVSGISIGVPAVILGLLYMQVPDWVAERAVGYLVAAGLVNLLADLSWIGAAPQHPLAVSAFCTFGYLAADLLLIAAITVDARRDFSIARNFLSTTYSFLPALAVLLSIAANVGVHVIADSSRAWLASAIAGCGAALLAAREFTSRIEVQRQHRAFAGAPAFLNAALERSSTAGRVGPAKVAALRREGDSKGSLGPVSSQTDRKIFALQMSVVGLVLFLTAIGNTYTSASDHARAGHPVPLWQPVVWEFSSSLMLWLLVPLVNRMIDRFPLTRATWWRSLPAHALAIAPFSLLHVVGMVLLRIAVYSTVVLHYAFSPFWVQWRYEFGKDVLTYATLVAALPAFRVYARWLLTKFDKTISAAPPAAPTKDPAPVDRLVVRKRNREFILEAAEIDRIESAGNYVTIYATGESYRMRDSLESVLRRLGEQRFARVHRTHVVNISRIREIQPWDHGDYRIVMKDGSFVNFSRRYRSRLGHLFG